MDTAKIYTSTDTGRFILKAYLKIIKPQKQKIFLCKNTLMYIDMKVCYPELWFRPPILRARGYFDSYIGHAKKGGAG